MRSSLILALWLLFAPQGQDEDPIARRASIYPHPPAPQHLQPMNLQLFFILETKHWYGKSHEPLQGRIEIAQKRAKDGWYENNHRDTDANGCVCSTVDIDQT